MYLAVKSAFWCTITLPQYYQGGAMSRRFNGLQVTIVEGRIIAARWKDDVYNEYGGIPRFNDKNWGDICLEEVPPQILMALGRTGFASFKCVSDVLPGAIAHFVDE